MSTCVLDNATIWTGDGTELDGHVTVVDDRITAVEAGRYAGELPTHNLGGLTLSPGLIDLMVCGGFGRGLMRDDPLEIAREYLRLGVTSFLLAIGTLPWDGMTRIADNARRSMAHKELDAARVLGVYLEGPFQHPRRTGGSLADHALPPTSDNVARLLDEFGDVFPLINVSPGAEGDVEAIRTLTAAGKIVSMAHSDAPAERVLACVDAGTTVLGHVWDNNPGLIGDSGVQQPTIEHVGLTDERVRFIHMLCDGQHVHPVMMKLVLRCRGLESLCVATDMIQRAGCPDGAFMWDDGRRFTKENGVGRTDKGMLAGSGTLLPDAVRNFVRFTGTPAAAAIRTVTYNPAGSLRLDDRIGLLAPGRVADIVAWDDRLRVRRVWRGGREIDSVSEFSEVRL